MDQLKTAIISTTAAFVLGTTILAPLAATAKSSDHRVFDGNVVHISATNIKVSGMEGGKMQTLSFTVDDGKKLMKKIHSGEYVRVVFDQKLLGLRHADSVDPHGDPGMKMKS